MNLEDIKLSELTAGSRSRIDLWMNFLRLAEIETMVEVGVWKGDFAKEMLQACKDLKRYYMIDPWANLPDWNKPLNVKPQVFELAYAEAMKKTAFAASKLTVLRGRTKEVVGSIPDNSLDFAYIDGDHTLRGITIDLIQVLPKIKPGGFIGGDDFTSSPWQHSARFEPTLVFPYSVFFAEAMDMPIVALPYEQFLMQKRVGTRFSFTDFTGRYKDLSLNKLRKGWPGIRPSQWAGTLLKTVRRKG